MGYLDCKNIFMFYLVIPIVFCGFLIMRNIQRCVIVALIFCLVSFDDIMETCKILDSILIDCS